MELDPDIAAHYAQGVERARLSTSSRLEADELHADIEQAGFLGTDVLAVEGPGARADLDVSLDEPGLRAAVLRAIARVEREPTFLGASPHLLAVATRP